MSSNTRFNSKRDSAFYLNKSYKIEFDRMFIGPVFDGGYSTTIRTSSDTVIDGGSSATIFNNTDTIINGGSA
jgi:hypothetical protein